MRPICCITGGKAGRVPGLPAALRPRRPEHGDCDHGGRQLPGPVRRMVCPSRQTKEHDSLISIICSSYRAFRILFSQICFFSHECGSAWTAIWKTIYPIIPSQFPGNVFSPALLDSDPHFLSH